jgi:hypothetical protein
MRPTHFILFFALSLQSLVEAKTCPKHLSVDVETKLVPVLVARANARRKNDWWDKSYEDAITKLFNATDSTSSEARIALMDYYVGEAYGEELVCAVALDDRKVIDVLELYSRCDIKPAVSTEPRDRNLPLREYALKMLKEGNAKEGCSYE